MGAHGGGGEGRGVLVRCWKEGQSTEKEKCASDSEGRGQVRVKGGGLGAHARGWGMARSSSQNVPLTMRRVLRFRRWVAGGAAVCVCL